MGWRLVQYIIAGYILVGGGAEEVNADGVC